MGFLGAPARVRRGGRLHHVDGQSNSCSVRVHPDHFPSFLQKDEVIARLAEGVNPGLMLGKHKYDNILNAGWPLDRNLASCVFHYNYQSNGDPSERAYTAFLAMRI